MRSRTLRPLTRRLLAVGAAGLLALSLSGCGGDDPDAAPTTTPAASSEAPPTTTTVDTSATTPEETATPDDTESTALTTPAEDVVEVEISIAGGQVTTPETRVPVSIGQTVRLLVTSDVDDELHVHGIEQEAELPAGQQVTLDFVIGTTPGPGLYEVETHESNLLLIELEVR